MQYVSMVVRLKCRCNLCTQKRWLCFWSPACTLEKPSWQRRIHRQSIVRVACGQRLLWIMMTIKGLRRITMGERESEGMGEGRRDEIGAQVAWTLTVWSQSHLHYNSTVLISLYINMLYLCLPLSWGIVGTFCDHTVKNLFVCVLLSLCACMCATIFHLWVWTIELIEHCKQYCHMLSHPAVSPIFCRCVVTP